MIMQVPPWHNRKSWQNRTNLGQWTTGRGGAILAPMDEELKGYQRAELFRQAHHRSPVVAVGKEGLSDALLDHFEKELENHELIKVRFTDFKDSRHTLSDELAARSGAHLVGVIGHIAIFYRMHPDETKRRIHVPER